MRRAMDITLKDLQEKIHLNSPRISRIIKETLRHEGIESADLSIAFVTRQRIKALNKKFLHRDYVTDVLAFALDDAELPKQRHSEKKTISGEIIISTDAAIGNTKIYSTSLAQEIVLYVIHGILHLLGFDDHDPKDIKRMRKKEEELLSFLGSKIKNAANLNIRKTR